MKEKRIVVLLNSVVNSVVETLLRNTKHEFKQTMIPLKYRGTPQLRISMDQLIIAFVPEMPYWQYIEFKEI